MPYVETTWYVNYGDGSTTGHFAVPKRAPSTAYTVGQIVRQFTAPAVAAERCFVCIVAGTTSASADATWTLTRGAKSAVDGTVTWQECTGQAALNGDATNTPTWTAHRTLTGQLPSLGSIIKRDNGASYQILTTSSGFQGATEPTFSDTAGVTATDSANVWTSLGPVANFTGGQAPFARLNSCFGSNWFASGNTVYVGDNHAEVQGVTLTFAPTSPLLAKILCHNHSGSYPPASGDMMTTASIATTGANVLYLSGTGSFFFYGITFSAGTAGGVVGNSGTAGNWYYFDACSFITFGNGAFTLGAATVSHVIIFNNCTVKFAAVGASLNPAFCQFTWQNTATILAAGSSIPTNLFNVVGGRVNTILLKNLDLSQLTGSLFTNVSAASIGTLTVQDCKLNAAMTITTPINTGMEVRLIRSDSATATNKQSVLAYEGSEVTDIATARLGGAVDPISGQEVSRKIVTTADAQWLRPFRSEPLLAWTESITREVDVTVYGLCADGALPTNDDVWIETEWLGSGASPVGTLTNTSKANVLSTDAPVNGDSSAWDDPVIIMDFKQGANIVISNGGLTVTHGDFSNNVGARSTTFVGAGKHYFEVTVGSRVGNNGTFGLFPPPATDFSGLPGTLQVSMSTFGGVPGGNGLGSTNNGDIFGLAIDLDNRLMWVRKQNGLWNNDAAANPVTGSNGAAIPVGTVYSPYIKYSSVSGNTDNVTFNFGTSAYYGTAPTGFGKWPGKTPFRITSTIGPQLAGSVEIRAKIGKPYATFYIDPEPVLTYTPESDRSLTPTSLLTDTDAFHSGSIGDPDLFWTPANLGADVWAWWKFDGMSEADGVAVATVVDSSGNGRTLTTVGSPTAKHNAQASLRALNFASGTKYATFASMSGLTAGAFFAVNKGTAGDMGGVCDTGTDTQVNHYTYSAQAYSDFLSTVRKSAGAGLTVSVWHQMMFWSAASDWGHAMDGTDKFTTGSNTVAGRATTSYLASDEAPGSWRHQGEFGEVVILLNKPTTLNRQKMEGYLAHKWGLTAALPGGHPYKTAPPAGGPAPPAKVLDTVANVTGAWSFGRDMLASFVGGTRYTKTGTAIQTLEDQSGSNRDFTDEAVAVRRPVETTAFPASVLCADFDGANHSLITSATVPSFVGVSSGAIVMSIIVDAAINNNATIYQNDTLTGDSGAYIGLHASTASGLTFLAYNWAGGTTHAAVTGAVGTAYVVMWRHHGGNLYVSVNGGTEVSVASGNTTGGGTLRIGSGQYTFGNFKLAEMFTTSDGSQTAALAAAIANMKTYIGA